MIALKKVLRKAVRIILCIIGILFTIASFGAVYLDYSFMKMTGIPPAFGFGGSVTLAVGCLLVPGIIFLVASYRMKKRDTNPIKEEEDTNEFLL